MTLSAPFPYFGGKKRWADHIWSKFGKADVYIEPFAGSLAVLLANRFPAKREVVCDKDGLICNFWRAITSDPEQTAHWADYPTIHQDLTARHKWLKQWAREHSSQLSENADYYDAKAAGWWLFIKRKGRNLLYFLSRFPLSLNHEKNYKRQGLRLSTVVRCQGVLHRVRLFAPPDAGKDCPGVDGGKGAKRLMYGLAGVPTQGDRQGWGPWLWGPRHH